jgi:hypothetical protein
MHGEWNRLKHAVRRVAWQSAPAEQTWLEDLLLDRGDPRLTWAEEGLLARVAALLRTDEPWPSHGQVVALRLIEDKLRSMLM